MKRQNMQDERVVAQRRKIQSDAYGILFYVLLISVVIQQSFLNAPFEQYAVEFICFIGMSTYIIVRNIAIGNNIFDDEKRAKFIKLINSSVAGITVTIINGVLNYAKYADHYKEDGIGYFIAVLVITFISATIPTFILLSVIGYLNKKKQDRVQKQLDEDEQDE